MNKIEQIKERNEALMASAVVYHHTDLTSNDAMTIATDIQYLLGVIERIGDTTRLPPRGEYRSYHQMIHAIREIIEEADNNE